MGKQGERDTLISPDGYSYWTGYEWRPTLSADGHWLWDGSRWNPTRALLRDWSWDGEQWVRRQRTTDRLRNLPRWLVWIVLVWLPLLVAWIPAVMVVASHHDSRSLVTSTAVTMGGIAVASTAALGATLGYRRAWGYLAWSWLLGMAALGLVMFFAFASAQPANQPDDPGFGFGALLLTLLLAPVVAALLWTGGGVGRLVRLLHR